MLRAVAACCFGSVVLFTCSWARGGQFPPQVGQPGSTAIAASDPRFVEWAATVQNLTRGPQDIAVVNSPPASFGVANNALGPNDGKVVSLGDGGQITVGFAQPIRNGSGPDFAVFENGFLSGAPLAFLELGFVDVSSDGTNFFRVPSESDTQTTTQVSGVGTLDASNLNNLAGKYIAGYGTPFDLQDLVGVSPLLDVNDIRFVRVTDVVGSINPSFGSRDSLGNLINDPFPTNSASSGFDLDAIGAINIVPEPGSLVLAGLAIACIAGWRRRRA